MNDQAVCSCLPEFTGSPPGCRPECVVSAECPTSLACIDQRCKNPCPGPCGIGAECNVIRHSPICACRQRYTGDPFSRCFPIPGENVSLRIYPARRIIYHIEIPVFLHSPLITLFLESPPALVLYNPCVPSPCGPNAECRDANGIPSCSCSPNYIGSPPNCRPECTVNSDCSPSQACMREKCRDPCPGSCGILAQCTVMNHVPVCNCIEGYTGDPFNNCYPRPPPRKTIGLISL